MKATIYRLAFELHKLPSEIYEMDATEFAEMIGYLEASNEQQKEASAKASTTEGKPRIPQTMG